MNEEQRRMLNEQIFVAVDKRETNKIEELIKAWADANTVGNFERTPYASEKGHTKIANILLANKANPNAITFENKSTPLYLAIESGYVETARALLNTGANVNVKNIYGLYRDSKTST